MMMYISSSEALPPDTYRKIPLCMEQHKNFSMCRIPGKSVDTVRKAPFTESRHVIVIRNGHVSLSCVMYLYSNHITCIFMVTY